jgi:hypothetical protein
LQRSGFRWAWKRRAGPLASSIRCGIEGTHRPQIRVPTILQRAGHPPQKGPQPGHVLDAWAA